MVLDRKKIFIVGAYPDSVCGFRGHLISKVISTGHCVTVMTAFASAEVQREIRALGAEYLSYPIERNGTNPWKDLGTKSFLSKTFVKHQPDLILAYTIKPIIWGGIAARSIPNCGFSALVTGLGYAFQRRTFKQRLLCHLTTNLYRYSLRRANNVIFQNVDNLNEFVSRKIIPNTKCRIVPGSGVSLSHYKQVPVPDGNILFLLIARLLKEKGIREYVEAAKIVKKQFPTSRFLLVGPSDTSPDGIPIEQIKNWDGEGLIEYCGATNDVRPYLNDCHVFVLPSYHEGMPRTVLEAMATGRPILTTDVCGCRETVENGKNGWLVPKGDAHALADRMIWFLENSNQLAAMGAKSRSIAAQKFDVNIVNDQMLKILGID
jgi:glycosyltransferase involved in cell wall biosynthesis